MYVLRYSSTLLRTSRTYTSFGRVVVRGDRREVRSGSLLRGHLDELVKIVRRQPDLFLDEIQTRMHERTGVMYGRSLLEAELLKKVSYQKCSGGWRPSETHRNGCRSGR